MNVDLDDDGNLDAGEPSATTGAGGAYSFTGLAPGTYHVVAAGEPGWTCSDCSATRTLTSGQQVSEDLGRWLAVIVTCTVYTDADGDGAQDAGELGIAGRDVFFDRNSDGSVDAG